MESKLVRSRELRKQISDNNNNDNKKIASYEVCWAKHKFSQSIKLNSYLDNAVFADVTISCQGQHIKCHKLILAAASSYFEDIFAEETVGNQLCFVAVVNMKHGVLKKLLEYIYKGSVVVHAEDIDDFLTYGDQLGIDGLCERGELPEMNPTDFVENSMNLSDDSGLPLELKLCYPEAKSVTQEKIPAKRRRKEKSGNNRPPVKSGKKTENASTSSKSVRKSATVNEQLKPVVKTEISLDLKPAKEPENVHEPLICDLSCIDAVINSIHK